MVTVTGRGPHLNDHLFVHVNFLLQLSSPMSLGNFLFLVDMFNKGCTWAEFLKFGSSKGFPDTWKPCTIKMYMGKVPWWCWTNSGVKVDICWYATVNLQWFYRLSYIPGCCRISIRRFCNKLLSPIILVCWWCFTALALMMQINTEGFHPISQKLRQPTSFLFFFMWWKDHQIFFSQVA